MADVFTEAPPLNPEDQRLVDAYTAIGRPLDDLPYTDDFERMYDMIRAEGGDADRQEVFHRLSSLRKAGRLPRLGRTSAVPVRIDGQEEEVLYDLIPMHCGTVGRRDRLPYTQEFENLVQAFNAKADRSLSKHDVWKLVARLAK